MKFPILLVALMATLLSFGQEQVSGYYIKNSGERINGFFKEGDFYNSESLYFKSAENDEYILLSPQMIKEYGIGDQFKFKKFDVKIDASQSRSARTYSTNRDPDWQDKMVFLNYIVEGDASLYSYKVDGETKYFYSLASQDIAPTQLVYKKYTNNGAVLENNAYRQDLFVKLQCNDENIVGGGLNYNESSLKGAVTRYNECKKSQQTTYNHKGSIGITSVFTVYIGANYSTFKLDSGHDTDSSSEITPGAGVEYALIFPSKKWGVFARVEYEKFKSEIQDIEELTFQTRIKTYKIDANYFSLSFGPRYYISPKLFADAGFGFNYGSGEIIRQHNSKAPNTDIQYGGKDTYDLGMHLYFSAGFGYVINEKFSVMANYAFDRNTISKEIGTDLKNNKFSLNARYTF